ncbi:hypothetical protein PCANC_28142 [Puccinia coronata f. sp. avenae]|uniref:tRNA(Phe) (4-demethylwyosine(37)-C(7)) aminocarboxypropyltransferase n=1 Tax=Puccinia coronata f. sp. avenae TaxID=200324 RepID=A0A2N5UDK9_9BASI|nr:hypothetical protein PCANC_28142 [Puccinia coronata f. sp. avenae]PLW35832.1 hypothetical protein PCASD_14429 [Puccinia coronata f. sp. avenae]
MPSPSGEGEEERSAHATTERRSVDGRGTAAETQMTLHAVCARQSVYALKRLLKQHALFSGKRPLLSSPNSPPNHPVVMIPTTLTRQSDPDMDDPEPLLPATHPSIVLPHPFICAASHLVLGFQWIRDSDQSESARKCQPASPLLRVVRAVFGAQEASRVVDELPKWELYDDFLLFQCNAFQGPHFSRLLEGPRRGEFFGAVAAVFKVSHVARKGLIEREQVSRPPNLEPLHGEFRSKVASLEDGTARSFTDVFWTSTRFPIDHAVIHYVWAPSETMYSRGNSPEKRRIAALNNVAGAVVVDMCCGIGFFAFGYLVAGAAKVVACEISPWAVEGLRRGAVLNGVTYEVLDPDRSDLRSCQPGWLDSNTSARLVIFPGPNERALPVYRHRATHVNLGLLPSSVQFLPQAVQALRPDQDGWLHIHGELAVAGGPAGRLQGADRWANQLIDQVVRLGRQSAKLVKIHWIKSVGPAKVHLVVELQVGPQQLSQ